MGGGAVVGTVMALWGDGVAGRKVTVAGQTTVTGPGGTFHLSDAPPVYDVVVAEPDESFLSVYRGVTRRDPVLTHAAEYRSTWDGPTAKASISGVLAGDLAFPLDDTHFVSVYFLGDGASSMFQLSTLLSATGPAYGPMTAIWKDRANIAGILLAIGRETTEAQHWVKAYLASQPLVLENGDNINQNPVLHAVANLRIGGSIVLQAAGDVDGLYISYHHPGTKAEIALEECTPSTTFACEVPDLTAAGGVYCATVIAAAGQVEAKRCGIVHTHPVAIEIQGPPQMLTPAAGAPISPDTVISWSAVKGAIYLVNLRSAFDSIAPDVQLYTVDRQLRLSDLQDAGVPFEGGKKYSIDVAALVPYVSMDDFASSHGLFANGIDRDSLNSTGVEVTLLE